jgi:hypothetical protein
LCGSGPGIAPCFISQKQVLELDHPRIGEKEGRIVSRDERGTLDALVSLLLEIVEK